MKAGIGAIANAPEEVACLISRDARAPSIDRERLQPVPAEIDRERVERGLVLAVADHEGRRSAAGSVRIAMLSVNVALGLEIVRIAERQRKSVRLEREAERAGEARAVDEINLEGLIRNRRALVDYAPARRVSAMLPRAACSRASTRRPGAR